MDERLASCAEGDVAALCAEIQDHLIDGTLASQSSQAPEPEVPQVLQYLASQSLAVGCGVATTLVADKELPLRVSGELLSAMLMQVKIRVVKNEEEVDDEVADQEPAEEKPTEETQENTAEVRAAVVAYAQRIAEELTKDERDAGELKLLASWADAVVDLAVMEELKPADDSAAETGGAWIVDVASALFRIHTHDAANRCDFRVMTLVWKNLNKLSTRHRGLLLQLCGDDAAHEYGLRSVFEAVCSSLAETTQRLRLRAAGGPEEDASDIGHELRMLRLFLRAFQGQFVQFVDSLVAQVECSVALAVDAIAAVIPFAEGIVETSDKMQHEAFRVLQCAIAFIETSARSDKLQESTRSFVGTLLWQPSNQLSNLVRQTRQQFVDKDDDSASTNSQTVEASLLWSHLLATSAFFVIRGTNDGQSDGNDDGTGADVSVFTTVGVLLGRFREWGRRLLIGGYAKTVSLFVDFILDVLVAQADSIQPLQLFLLEQTVYPDPNQRFVVWEIWRELVCFVWDDAVSSHAIKTLVLFTQSKVAKGIPLDTQVQTEIVQLLAFLYPEVSGPVKHEYLQLVSSAFDLLCAEGPGHKLTAELEMSLDLLDLLASSSLLPEYGESDKEDWVAHYLPMATECIGSVHCFLESGEVMTGAQRDAVLRVIDGGLLIVRAIFEDNDEAGAQGLSPMVLAMCTETLMHLAKMTSSNGWHPSKSFSRVLESCLLLFTRLSPQVKANRGSQCVQIVKDLLTILQAGHDMSVNAVTIAVFVRDALSDLCVLPSDAEVTWKLFARLFHKLSALHFGLQVDPTSQPLTPPQSVCLEAMYQVFANSNLPEYANRKRSLKDWLVPHAQPRFATFLQMMCEGKRTQAQDWRQSLCRAYDYRKQDDEVRRRLPRQKEQVGGSDDAAGEVSDTSSNSTTRVRLQPAVDDDPGPVDIDMLDEEIENAKRVKWDAFASTYWKLHESLLAMSCPEDQQAFLDKLTENDLDQATSALQQLL